MTDKRHCGNPVCYCTGACIGKPASSPAVFTKGPAVSQIWPGKPEHEPIEPPPELGKAWLESIELSAHNGEGVE